MKCFSLAAGVIALGFIWSPAQAQNARSFVSGHGADTNNCTLAAPCRTFQHAHDQTNAGGEIDVLDPGGYGALTINKAISIQGHGFSGITAPSGFAILINAGATDQINLRGLLIEGLGSGFAGVVVGQVGSLNIQDSLIRKFTEDGIAFSAGNSKLSVSHTVVSGNVSAGIAITSASNAMAINAVLEQVELYDNGDGIAVAADRSDAGNQPVQLTVSNSTIANNSNGINCNTSTAQKVSCMVRNSTIANNSNVGVFTFTGATNSFIVLSRTMITGSGTAAWVGNVFSYGDNQIDFNKSGNTSPTQTPSR